VSIGEIGSGVANLGTPIPRGGGVSTGRSVADPGTASRGRTEPAGLTSSNSHEGGHRAETGTGGGGVSPEQPPGIDPDLWSVLTTEERAYYSRAQALGPLTYGRDEIIEATESVGLGGRIDLRV